MRPRRTTDARTGRDRGGEEGDARARVLIVVLAVQVLLAAALIAWVLAGSPLP